MKRSQKNAIRKSHQSRAKIIREAIIKTEIINGNPVKVTIYAEMKRKQNP